MKKSELEKYIDTYVQISLTSGQLLKGFLYKTEDPVFNEYINIGGFKKYYLLMSLRINDCNYDYQRYQVDQRIFRSSHVKKLVPISLKNIKKYH